MKNKVVILVSLYFFGLMISMVSCVDDCGPFPDKFKIESMNLTMNTFHFTDGELVNFFLVKDTVGFEQLGINLDVKTETYFSLNESSQRDWGFDLISTAYACSPVIPTTDERIDSIQIFSNVSFDENHNPEDNLSDLFDVIVPSKVESSIYEKLDLQEFLDTKPFLNRDLTLVLKSGPSEMKAIQFSIKYFQNGIDHDEFDFITDEIVLK